MARLPQPGDDVNEWGDILNTFLLVAHNPDGTAKDTTPDATITTKGKVRLNGDISGTADSVTVVSTSLNSPLPIEQGGTSANTAQGALNALLPDQTNKAGQIIQTDGTNASWVVGPNNDDLLALTWMEVAS